MKKLNVLNDAIPATIPLLVILGIIFLTTVAFIVFQLFSGNVPCGPFDAFDGTSGVVPILDDVAEFPEKSKRIIDFVLGYRKAIRDNKMTMGEIKNAVKNAYNQTTFLTAFRTKGKDRGQLFATGKADGVCEGNNPYCTVWAGGSATYFGKKEGDQCWDLRGPDGRYIVRGLINVANRGGGWYGVFWTNPRGLIISQYIYVAPVPEHDLLLASVFYANRLL